jgi:uncharacterized protein (DUF924 family)
MNDSRRPEGLLDFWFGPARHDAGAIGQRMAFWFKPGSDDDDAVRERFEAPLREAATGKLTRWQASAAGRLALVLTLDQAPRVIFRRQAAAFMYDGQALSLTLAGIDAGVDESMGLAERAFFYMPLQHSEDPLVQARSVREYEGLVETFPDHADVARGFLKYAREHAEIIERFGRYPHRNKALGRESTEAERAFLEDGPTYGQ